MVVDVEQQKLKKSVKKSEMEGVKAEGKRDLREVCRRKSKIGEHLFN